MKSNIKRQPKILIFTVSSWNSKIGSNTWASLLEGYSNAKLANICIREEYPDSDVCSRYFRISENRIIKSIFNYNIQTGQEIKKSLKANIEINSDLKEHNVRYKIMKKRKSYILLMVREIVWKIGKWKTLELDNFLDDFKPDIILHSMEGYIHLNRIVEYSIKRTKAKSIGYIWDDNFTYKQSHNLGYRIYRFFQRKSLKKLASITNSFFAITEQTKKEADKYFGINCTVLTKPLIEIPTYTQKKIQFPIKILYTGKLIIGRDITILKIVNSIKRINSERKKLIQLDIYTNSHVSKEYIKNISNSMCKIYPAVTQKEVQLLQKKADILLFVEALDGEESQIARLSFSTKITDYFSTGNCILAVGNKETAPMDYFIKNNSALVAYDEKTLNKVLNMIIEKPDIINEVSKNSIEIANLNHNPLKIKQIFWGVIEEILKI